MINPPPNLILCYIYDPYCLKGWLQNKKERLKGLSQRLLWSSSGCVFWHPWGPSSALQAVSVCPSSLGPASTPMGRCATSPPIRQEHTRPSANQSPRSVCGPRGTGGTLGLPEDRHQLGRWVWGKPAARRGPPGAHFSLGPCPTNT